MNAEEAQVLAAIVRGDRPDLRNRNLIRLSRLRLIMVQGATRFVPTALGYDWYRRLGEQMQGDTEAGASKSASKNDMREGFPEARAGRHDGMERPVETEDRIDPAAPKPR